MLSENSLKGKAGFRRRLFAAGMAAVIVLSGCSAPVRDDAGNAGAADLAAPGSGDAGMDSTTTDHSIAVYPKESEIRDDAPRFRGDDAEVVQAGQLTAGEWDDLAAWERFGNLLNSEEGDRNLRYWGYRAFNRLEVIVSSDGRAVADAEVLLIDEQDNTVWEAKTNAGGTAYLFAGLFETDERQERSSYTVMIRAGNAEKETGGIRIPDQGALKVDLDGAATDISERADIMFVVDTTGSMQDELNYLEAELKDVTERVGERHGGQYGIRIGTIFYRDKHDSYVVKPYPFTDNVDKAVQQIADQKASGGGDYPEAVDLALREAVSGQQWSGNAAARLLFLVMDAPPHHDEPQTVEEMQDLAADAAKQGIRIIPVASSGVDVETEYLMRFLAVATGGTYLFLTDDSGIGGDHLEPAVGEYEVRLLNDLLVDVISRYLEGP